MAVATAPRAAPPVPATLTATAYEDRVRKSSPVVVGTAFAVVADLMVFAGLLAAYFGLRATAFRWPPKGVAHGTYLPGIITLTMVMSIASAQWASYAIRRSDRRNCLFALGLTIVFGLAVVIGESYGFGRSGFGLSKHAYGTMHDALIGFHLLNVVVAIAALAVVFVQTLTGAASEERPGPVSAVGLFWHFTSVVWLVIFFVLYLAT